jgi:2',3'-cyclic-nucleotide 2'-phosphodiesterase/3'-nucleotidase
MKSGRLFTLGLFFLSFLAACASDDNPGDPGDSTREIIVLYTNDEQGWMQATENTGGAAGMKGLWQEKEGYSEDGPYLILSGGDMWTGPAISTWFKGESMAEVMNAMDYTAAAIGNHEFDYGVTNLQARLAQSDFPFLSANIREKATNTIPEFATPYIIREVNDVQVGIIGLTTTSTPYTAFPDNVRDYNFIPYADALQQVVPQVKAGGAELLIVAGHICDEEMQALAQTAARLGISLIGGGHCEEVVNEVTAGVTLVETGSNMRRYAAIRFQ